MAANWELQLISAILEDQDLDTPKRIYGIDSSCFITKEARDLYNEIDRFWHNRKHFGQVPPISWIEDKFPAYMLPEPEGSLQVLCEFVQEGYTRRRLMDFADTLADLAEESDDPEEAVEFMLRESKNLARVTTPGGDLDFGQTALEKIQHEIQLIEEAGGMKGYPWPWESMNRNTAGLENGGLYTIYGRPGSMKTWLMLHMACNLYVNCGLRVLVWCKEMPKEQMMTRMACLIGQVSYTNYTKGRLRESEKARLLECLRIITEDEKTQPSGQKLLITEGNSTVGASATTSIAGLRAKAEEFQPQAIFCDSFYHAQASVKWQDITGLCMQMKELAMEQKLPLVCTWQANRMTEKSGKGASTGMDMAMGDALVRESDMLMRVYLHETEDPEETLLSLDVTKSRESAKRGITIHAVPAHNFEWYSDKVFYSMKEDDSRNGKKSGKFDGMSKEPNADWAE